MFFCRICDRGFSWVLNGISRRVDSEAEPAFLDAEYFLIVVQLEHHLVQHQHCVTAQVLRTHVLSWIELKIQHADD